jgi:hypothetical protein
MTFPHRSVKRDFFFKVRRLSWTAGQIEQVMLPRAGGGQILAILTPDF